MIALAATLDGDNCRSGSTSTPNRRVKRSSIQWITVRSLDTVISGP